MARFRQLQRIVAAGGVAALAIGAVTASAAAQPTTAQPTTAQPATAGREAIAGTRPAWATAARQVHRPAALAVVTRAAMTVNVYLSSRDPAGLAAFAAAASLKLQ